MTPYTPPPQAEAWGYTNEARLRGLEIHKACFGRLFLYSPTLEGLHKRSPPARARNSQSLPKQALFV